MSKKATKIYVRRGKQDRRTRRLRHLGEATLGGGEGRWVCKNRKYQEWMDKKARKIYVRGANEMEVGENA